jgi:cysteine desulfurase
VLDLEALEEALSRDEGMSKIVSVIYANNETGVIQDLRQIVNIAHKYQALVHTDAVQAYGKINIDLLALEVDLITISAHKICGPLGVGALIAKKNISLLPQIKGGGQEKNLRAGTHNMPAIVGFGMIAADINSHIENIAKLRALRDYIEENLAAKAIVFSQKAPRLSNTSCMAMPGVANEMQVMHFDLRQIFLSAGSACSSGKIKFSHVLKAYGYEQELIQCAIRVSLGIDNTKADADNFISNWFDIYEKLGVKKQYA